ncbi:RNA-directed RNA polymerase [ssRNA phage Gerhypos.1_18]|uniref:RNA-directed RNA polymerase n=2 Tax=Fiersviridae TaxID=2842319 RepID=A0A8S5KXU4_9VIRU|nr:RNA-directed RNA polymerase [ssRNA phage Gerhypos.1_18]QDH86728.1 MAG: RNA-dependent RNA polymerase [Leviviridae sp.]DAD50088.1 TPA_asm: RNA-directed RNA polymerase [ssRNA phage Gerhypos.1_18]
MHPDIHSDMGEVFFALCKAVDSPVSLGVWLRYKYSHSELASLDVNPRDYTCAASFRTDYLVQVFLSKYKGLDTGIDKTEVALQKFKSSEAVCAETNVRFRNLETVRNGRLHGVLHLAQRKISRLLGPFTVLALDRRYGWGPGASTDIPRRRASVDTKICELPISVSRSARAWLRHEIESDLHWSESILGLVPSGSYCLLDSVFVLTDECRIETVPKNAKTERVIAVEPRGNSFLQKGIGSYIRSKLRSVGVNLDDQTRNQELARRAYSESLATLDLRAASDTVSREVVYSLLPYDWAASLDAVRTRRAEMPDGTSLVLEKFSSMGNGFTFELESLIFWALSSAVAESNNEYGEVAVYGDDIIVPRSVATELCLTLQFCGFSVNDEKSFIDGPFFESCGKHFFCGEDVTPAYQKEPLDGLPEVIRCANRLMRLSLRLDPTRYLVPAVRPAWEHLVRSMGEVAYAIPLGSEGDDGLLLNRLDFSSRRVPAVPKGRQIRGFDGEFCRVMSFPTRSFIANDRALLAWTLRDRHKVLRPKTVLETLFDEQLAPFLGQVEFPPKGTNPSTAYRWVIPTGEFDLV